MADMELYCEAGDHNWTRESKRGRPPRNCPEHMPEKPAVTLLPPRESAENPAESENDTKYRWLLCEGWEGHPAHMWRAESKRGRKPRFCEEYVPPETVGKSRPVSSQSVDKAIEQVMNRTQVFSCGCDIHLGMTQDEIRGLGAGCTDPQFVCPTLDAVRRLIGT